MSRKNREERRLAKQQQGQPAPGGAFFVAQGYSGPLPPPGMLADYDQIFPGCAERIVAMAESNARHRQELERAVVLGNVQAQSRGQWMGFGISVLAVAAGIAFVAMGLTAAGVSVILGDVGALAGIFIYGRYRQERERREKLAPFSGQLLP